MKINFLHLAADPAALALNVAVDVLGWACDRFVEVAEPVGEFLIEAADLARWVSTATRTTP